MDSRPLKVFLCHASADKPAVRDLYKRLVADGVDAWLDAESLIPGQNWQVEIPKAIRDSDVVLVCLSEKSINKEGYVQKEIKSALDVADEKPEGTIFIIPARLEECKTPDRLSIYHWVDLYEEDGYQRLIRALRLRAEKIGAVLQAKKGWLNGFTVPVKKPAPKKPESVEKEPISQPEEPKSVNPRKWDINKVITGVAFIIILLMVSLPWDKWFATAPNLVTVTPTNTVAFTLFQPPLTKTPLTLTFTPVSPKKTKTPTLAITATSQPTEFIDEKGVQMILVPSGEFTMGNENGSGYEKPVHQVYLDDFYMDKYEVTNSLYKTCVRAGECEPPTNSTYYYDYYDDPKYESHPVVSVEWDMAKTYCEWRSASLPTEAQWEKAARGIDGRTYPWGEGVECNKANYEGCKEYTTPVGSYESGKSPYGIYDLAGNVWELTADWYSEAYYQNSPSANPLGPDLGQYRVLRGGSWNVGLVNSTLRYWYQSRSWGNDNIGFRCARDANP